MMVIFLIIFFGLFEFIFKQRYNSCKKESR